MLFIIELLIPAYKYMVLFSTWFTAKIAFHLRMTKLLPQKNALVMRLLFTSFFWCRDYTKADNQFAR